MKREQRIEAIISGFSDGDREHVAHLVEQAYRPSKQMRVENVIESLFGGYFERKNIDAVLNSDEIQIHIDTLLRDIAEKVAEREYAIEIDNLNIEGKQNEL